MVRRDKGRFRRVLAALACALPALSLAACADQTQRGAYQQITPQEARQLMEDETERVILDVRSQAEFDQGHIEGALLIPDDEIQERAPAELPDQQQLILVYCRSGRRSKAAAAQLAELGYANVKEFGGILDWPYETVS